MKKGNWIFIFTLIVIAGLSRLLPHPPNFTAIGAMALFGGAALSSRVMRIALPLIALFVTDLIINNTVFASNEGFTMFYPGAVWTYVAIGSIALLAPMIINKLSLKKVALGSLMASVLFFTISNFGVWASGILYPMTAEGLATCYVAAIPFFGNTLGGDVLFSAVLFGGFYLAELKMPKLALSKN